MSSETFQFEVEQNRAIVTLLPGLNEVPWADIERVGTEVLSRLHTLSSPALVVDLCQLNYMGSAQVALVVRMFKTVKERKGKMVVANRDPMVLEVLQLAGLTKVWTMADSRESAVKMVGGSFREFTPHREGGGGGGGGAAAPVAYPSSGAANSGILPVVIALTGTLVAALAITAFLARPDLQPALLVSLGFATLGFAGGLWGTLSTQGTKQILSILGLVVAVLILFGGVFKLVQNSAPGPAPVVNMPTSPTPGLTGAGTTSIPSNPPAGSPAGGAAATPADPSRQPSPPTPGTKPAGAVPGGLGSPAGTPTPPGLTPPGTTPPGATPSGTPGAPPK